MTTAPTAPSTRVPLAVHVGILAQRLGPPKPDHALHGILPGLRRIELDDQVGDRVWWTAVDGLPRWEEGAAIAALHLYAHHQQGVARPMHQPGHLFGRSLGELVRGRTHTDNVERRFTAVQTSTSIPEAAEHLRGLIHQLRIAGIPADYGRLAADLLTITRPDPTEWHATTRRWARQYVDARTSKSPTGEKE